MILKAESRKSKAESRKANLHTRRHFSLFTFYFLLTALCLLISPLTAQDRINLNTASAEELMRLPYVGNTVAHRILEHRRKHGNFKRPQDIIVIKGLSAKRYRQIAHLIRL